MSTPEHRQEDDILRCVLPRCTRTDREVCVLYDHRKELDHEVQQAQAALESALERRRQLNAKINDHHSISYRLPVEVNSNIFRLAMPPPPNKNDFNPSLAWSGLENFSTQLRLGSVCQRWRSIIWSNPLLWTVVYLEVKKEMSPSYLKTMKECINRSGELPLMVCIEFHIGKRDAITQQIEPGLFYSLTGALCDSIHRWFRAQLIMPRCYLAELKSNRPNLNVCDIEVLSLKTVSQDFDHREQRLIEHSVDEYVDFGVTIKPEYFSTFGFRPRKAYIDFTGLISLTLEYVFINDALAILRSSTRLVHCKLSCMRETHEALAFSTAAMHITLPFLRSFEIRLHSEIVWKSLTCPDLRKLVFYTLDLRHIRAFIVRSRCSLLQQVAISTISGRVMREVGNILELTPNVTLLESNPSPTDHVFQRLHMDREFLPHLSKLSCRGIGGFSWPCFADVAVEAVSGGGEEQSGRPLKEITIDITSWIGEGEPFIIDSDSLYRIHESSQRGLKITLKNDTFGNLMEHSMQYWGIQLEDS